LAIFAAIRRAASRPAYAHPLFLNLHPTRSCARCSISGAKEREASDVSRLSDAELIQRLADQAKELGIEIDLNYSFAQKKSDE
jgi:hypothetical protein